MEKGQRNKAGRPALRLVLADDHAILRHALATLLDAQADVQVVAQASDGREAIDATERHRPDVVIMDVGMPRMNGIEATRQIHERFPATRVIVLSAYGDSAAVGGALAAGACGFIIKRSDIEELVLALRLVTTGNVYVSRELAEQMDIGELTFAARNREQQSTSLTEREREVVQLIAEGHTLKAIAEILVLSPKTVEGHSSRIMAKVGARNRADLVRYAVGAGLVRTDRLSDTA